MVKTQVVPCTKEEIDAIMNAAMDNEYYYLTFKTSGKTGRRLGELYGEYEMEVVKEEKYVDSRGLQKIRKIKKKTGKLIGGVQVKDIDFEKKIMMTQVLKRRKRVYKEAILDDELVMLMKRYIAKNKLTLEDYLFRKVSYNAIQKAIKRYAEKAGVKHVVSMHCVSEDTEILTIDGWKKHSELMEGERVYSLNMDTKLIEQDIIRKKFVYHYQGDVYHINNRYIDSIITPEHKIIAKYSTAKQIDNVKRDYWVSDYKLTSIRELMETKTLRQLKCLIGGYKKSGRSIGHHKASLLGWILSDACISKSGDITIQQDMNSNSKKCEIISNILANSGIPYSFKIQKEKCTGFNTLTGKKTKLVIFRLFKGKTRNYLKGEENKGKEHDWIYEFIDKDRTPKMNLLELCDEELKAIVDNMMLGDGSKNGEYAGQNQKRIDFLRIACLFIGKKTSLGSKKQQGKMYHRTYLSKDPFCNIHLKTHKENYSGAVWCVETNNGNFLARRNEKIFLTGNSFRHRYITSLILQGWSYDKIAKLTGHGVVGTIACYDHTVASDIADDARKAIAKL